MKSRAAICAVVVMAAVFLTFGRVITFDFVGGWDDGPLIVDNPLINPPTGEASWACSPWLQLTAAMFKLKRMEKTPNVQLRPLKSCLTAASTKTSKVESPPRIRYTK